MNTRRVRVHFVLPDKVIGVMDGIKQTGFFSSRTEVLKEAICLYEYLLQEVADGKEIGSWNDGKRISVETPNLRLVRFARRQR